MTHDEIEWTEEERAKLDALPRENDPGQMLEEKTVAALKARGHLGGTAAGERDAAAGAGTAGRRSGGAGRPGRPGAGPFHPAWWAAGIAAALALFFGGLAFGQARSGITTDELMAALRAAEAAERPSLVQQTGSMYVDALASLAMVQDENAAAVNTGVEVGLAALYAAAYEMARLHPDDPRLREVLRALESPANGDPETELHWF